MGGVTRYEEPGAYRNLIGLKVSDHMLVLIENMRGDVSVQVFLRGLISDAADRGVVRDLPDWERRARVAEMKLGKIREMTGG